LLFEEHVKADFAKVWMMYDPDEGTSDIIFDTEKSYHCSRGEFKVMRHKFFEALTSRIHPLDRVIVIR